MSIQIQFHTGILTKIYFLIKYCKSYEEMWESSRSADCTEQTENLQNVQKTDYFQISQSENALYYTTNKVWKDGGIAYDLGFE